eukprot:s65_g21.t1
MLKLHSEDINETGCNWHISEQSPAPQKFSSTFALTSSKVCFVLIHKIKIEPQSGDGTIGSETAAGTGVGAIEEESQDANSRGARQEANEDQRKPLRFATCRGHAHLHSTALSLEMGASCRWRMPPQPTPAGWSCAPWFLYQCDVYKEIHFSPNDVLQHFPREL